MGAAWYHVARADVVPPAHAALAALRASGLDLHPLGPIRSGTVGLFLFGRGGGECAAELAGIVRDTGARVLAVCVDDGAWTGLSPWTWIEAGAADAVAWSESGAGNVGARLARWIEVEALCASAGVRACLVGGTQRWLEFVRETVEVARYSSSSVLFLGESGTGKELAAGLVHGLDPRPDKRDLVVLDCTTIVPELAGSEFFGHERGAYTGAVGARQGAVALADGGTLFLDEVAELPLGLQAQLLRVIQERTYKAVGGNAWRRTEFRLICATNRDLPGEIVAGRFRADLYYRIAATVVRVPPLREHTADVLPLARHFLAEAGVHAELAPHVRAQLLSREYRGNVRELRQIVLQAARRHVGDGPISVGDLPPEARVAAAAETNAGELERAVAEAVARGASLRDIRRAAEDAAVRAALALCGSQRQACARLGVTPRAVQLRARRSGRPPDIGDAPEA